MKDRFTVNCYTYKSRLNLPTMHFQLLAGRIPYCLTFFGNNRKRSWLWNQILTRKSGNIVTIECTFQQDVGLHVWAMGQIPIPLAIKPAYYVDFSWNIHFILLRLMSGKTQVSATINWKVINVSQSKSIQSLTKVLHFFFHQSMTPLCWVTKAVHPKISNKNLFLTENHFRKLGSQTLLALLQSTNVSNSFLQPVTCWKIKILFR